MKRAVIILAVLFGIFVIPAGNVLAGDTSDPEIQDRIADQQKRIDQGVASGELTAAEAHQAQTSLNKIKNLEAKLKADGMLTQTERRRLNSMLDHSSKFLYKKKHNPRTAR